MKTIDWRLKFYQAMAGIHQVMVEIRQVMVEIHSMMVEIHRLKFIEGLPGTKTYSLQLPPCKWNYSEGRLYYC